MEIYQTNQEENTIPSLADQMDNIRSFCMKLEQWERRLDHIIGYPQQGPPTCENTQGSPVQHMTMSDCDCVHCATAKSVADSPRGSCHFCHYRYYEKPDLVYGLFGHAFVRCPNCSNTHSWSTE